MFQKNRIAASIALESVMNTTPKTVAPDRDDAELLRRLQTVIGSPMASPAEVKEAKKFIAEIGVVH